jgi:hypothetical protein
MYESPRLRGYLFVGIVVFSGFPYTATVERTVYHDRRRFNHEGIVYPTVLVLSRAITIIFVVALLSACGEPMFDNAGSQHSLLEDREACAMEMEQSPTAIAYRQNPTAHPDYVSQVFTDMNRCIERKGWKQVRSQQEQEQVNQAMRSELAHTEQPAPRSDLKATEAFVRGVEERLARVPSSAR